MFVTEMLTSWQYHVNWFIQEVCLEHYWTAAQERSNMAACACTNIDYVKVVQKYDSVNSPWLHVDL